MARATSAIGRADGLHCGAEAHRKPLQVDKLPILRYTIDNKRQGIGLGPFHIFTEVVVSW